MERSRASTQHGEWRQELVINVEFQSATLVVIVRQDHVNGELVSAERHGIRDADDVTAGVCRVTS